MSTSVRTVRAAVLDWCKEVLSTNSVGFRQRLGVVVAESVGFSQRLGAAVAKSVFSQRLRLRD